MTLGGFCAEREAYGSCLQRGQMGRSQTHLGGKAHRWPWASKKSHLRQIPTGQRSAMAFQTSRSGFEARGEVRAHLRRDTLGRGDGPCVMSRELQRLRMPCPWAPKVPFLPLAWSLLCLHPQLPPRHTHGHQSSERTLTALQEEALCKVPSLNPLHSPHRWALLLTPFY